MRHAIHFGNNVTAPVKFTASQCRKVVFVVYLILPWRPHKRHVELFYSFIMRATATLKQGDVLVFTGQPQHDGFADRQSWAPQTTGIGVGAHGMMQGVVVTMQYIILHHEFDTLQEIMIAAICLTVQNIAFICSIYVSHLLYYIRKDISLPVDR